jgi:hypothetical protein
MATIGDILDEFFSPFSSEKLWVMPENDNYTQIVRKWDPVIKSVDRAKNNLASFCTTWATSYVSAASWKPTMTDSPKTRGLPRFRAKPARHRARNLQKRIHRLCQQQSRKNRYSGRCFHTGYSNRCAVYLLDRVFQYLYNGGQH